MNPRDPWWRGLGPGDEMAPCELEALECDDCGGTGADEHGQPCETCEGSGLRTCDEVARVLCDAWDGLL